MLQVGVVMLCAAVMSSGSSQRQSCTSVCAVLCCAMLCYAVLRFAALYPQLGALQ